MRNLLQRLLFDPTVPEGVPEAQPKSAEPISIDDVELRARIEARREERAAAAIRRKALHAEMNQAAARQAVTVFPSAPAIPQPGTKSTKAKMIILRVPCDHDDQFTGPKAA
jgi:hypothetical protein